jgi:hypothetical protein
VDDVGAVVVGGKSKKLTVPDGLSSMMRSVVSGREEGRIPLWSLWSFLCGRRKGDSECSAERVLTPFPRPSGEIRLGFNFHVCFTGGRS